MDLLIEIIEKNPLLYGFFVVINSLFIGVGAGMGFYKGINKLFDYWLSIKVKTDKIPALITLNKDNHKKQQEEIRALREKLEEHDQKVCFKMKEGFQDE